jgi:ABC-type multidrug transport system ATPase subunit
MLENTSFTRPLKGYLADKLVILTANQLQYLPYADHILFLNEGSVVATGNFTELMQTNVVFKDQMAKFGVTSKGEQEEKSEAEEKPKETIVVEEPKENITKS